jgi:hypothetical protein
MDKNSIQRCVAILERAAERTDAITVTLKYLVSEKVFAKKNRIVVQFPISRAEKVFIDNVALRPATRRRESRLLSKIASHNRNIEMMQAVVRENGGTLRFVFEEDAAKVKATRHVLLHDV